MASFPSAADVAPAIRAEIPGRAPEAYFRPTPGVKLTVDDPAALAPKTGSSAVDDHAEPGAGGAAFPSTEDRGSTPGLDFYEKFHVVPRAIALGNVLSTTTTTLEVFSAFRRSAEFWTAFDNNAGAGVSLLGAPALPVLVQPMAGFLLSVQVNLSGPAVVNSTLDFTFNITGLVRVPISFQRVVLFAVSPESVYDETLEWLTDVLVAEDQTEQRRALRKNPRQSFAWEMFLEDGPERSLFENILFDWQSRVFGLPVWHESTPLTAAVTGGATTVITVASTADADYRDGGLVVLWESQTKFDVLNLVSHTATTLTVLNPPASSYTPKADLVLVAPLRLAVADRGARGSRYLLGQDRFRATFRVKDNDSNLADASTFSTLNSKVLLDDFNFSAGQMDEDYQHEIVVVDGHVGLTQEDTRQDRHRRASVKGFVLNTKAGLWRVRKLLHFLRGRQTSFYLPTFSKDLTPIATMTSGQVTLAITNVGYTNFVRTRQPKNIIRVVPVAGAGSPFIRTISGSSVASSVQENITVTSAWPSTLTPAQIERIAFVEKVRQDSDSVRIRHERGTARRVAMPVRAVLE